jgi:hypothetical protein
MFLECAKESMAVKEISAGCFFDKLLGKREEHIFEYASMIGNMQNSCDMFGCRQIAIGRSGSVMKELFSN